MLQLSTKNSFSKDKCLIVCYFNHCIQSQLSAKFICYRILYSSYQSTGYQGQRDCFLLSDTCCNKIQTYRCKYRIYLNNLRPLLSLFVQHSEKNKNKKTFKCLRVYNRQADHMTCLNLLD